MTPADPTWCSWRFSLDGTLITHYQDLMNCSVCWTVHPFVDWFLQCSTFWPSVNFVVRVWLQLVSVVLGHRCIALKELRSESKAQVHALVPPAGAMERLLTIEGTVEQIQKAQYLVQKRSDSVFFVRYLWNSEMCQIKEFSVTTYVNSLF